MNRKILTIGLSAFALLVFVSASNAATLYLNTFDDTGSVNLQGDPTAASDLFKNVKSGTKGSNPSGSEGVSEGTFTPPGDTNVAPAAASGDYASFYTSATNTDFPEFTGNNLSFADSATTRVSPFYQSVVDEINGLGAGTYDLTIEFDYAGEKDNNSATWGVLVFGDATGTSGRWTGVRSVSLDVEDGPDTFKHSSLTFDIELVDSGADPKNAGTFTVGQFEGFRVGFNVDNRGGTNPAVLNIDNLQFSSDTIPEPASLALLGLGGLACLRRRRA